MCRESARQSPGCAPPLPPPGPWRHPHPLLRAGLTPETACAAQGSPSGWTRGQGPEWGWSSFPEGPAWAWWRGLLPLEGMDSSASYQGPSPSSALGQSGGVGMGLGPFTLWGLCSLQGSGDPQLCPLTGVLCGPRGSPWDVSLFLLGAPGLRGAPCSARSPLPRPAASSGGQEGAVLFSLI